VRMADPVTLNGERVSLAPLSLDHLVDLQAATADGELWKLWYTTVPEPAHMAAEIDRRLGLQSTGSMLPFGVIEPASGRVVGMTSYLNIDETNRRLEIGGTWYARRVQRTGLNTEAKLLLLTHAFESLDTMAVEFRTHHLNRQSRAGIERLGARLDGILRQHQLGRDGTLRDTCVYSVLDREWPTVKRSLQYFLAR
jgi:RimJ/RimL family protein N-acetyltransferase